MASSHNFPAMVIPADCRTADCPKSGVSLWQANDRKVAQLSHSLCIPVSIPASPSHPEWRFGDARHIHLKAEDAARQGIVLQFLIGKSRAGRGDKSGAVIGAAKADHGRAF